MKAGIKTESSVKPNRFVLNKLSDGSVEVYVNEDIKEFARESQGESGTPKETMYEYTSRFSVGHYHDSDSLTEAYIALKYSTGAEISLGRKGLTQPNDAEYLEYIQYVNDCKAFVKANFRA